MELFYELEFKFIPYIFNTSGASSLFQTIYLLGSFFAKKFNDFYNFEGGISKNYTAKDFYVEIFPIGEEGFHIARVILPSPPEEERVGVYCLEYLIAFEIVGNSINYLGLFMVEYGAVFGTKCICSVGEKFNHINYGPASDNFRNNALKIKEIALGKKSNNRNNNCSKSNNKSDGWHFFFKK